MPIKYIGLISNQGPDFACLKFPIVQQPYQAPNLLNLKNPIPVTSSGYDGYKALAVIMAIYRSAAQNGKTIVLE